MADHHEEKTESTAPNTPQQPAAQKPAAPAPQQEQAPVGHMLAAGDGAPSDPASEVDIWTGRTSWKHYFGSVVLAVLLIIAVWWGMLYWAGLNEQDKITPGLAIKIALIATGALLLIAFIRIGMKVLVNKYRLTSQRLLVDHGILSITTDQTELIRVDDVRIYRKLMDRIMGLGTVEVLSTDATDNKLHIVGIHDSEKVAENIRHRMRQLRSKSLFVENL